MLQILFFGNLKEVLKKESLTIKYEEEMILADVVKHLGISPPFLCAVNQAIAPVSTLLKDGDEIAFMPPFSGG